MSREVKIGLFLAGTLIILAVAIFVIGDLGKYFNRRGYPLYASFETVAGLDRRAVVRLSGVRVGSVEEINLEGSRPVVKMNINKAVSVPDDSRATLASLGLLGEKYIEILPGKSGRACAPGARLASLASVSFDQMGLLLLSIGSEVRELSGALRDLMNEENKQRLVNTLDNLSSLTENLETVVRENREALGRGVRDASRAFQGLDQTIQDVSRDVRDSASSLRSLLEDNKGLVKTNLEEARQLLLRIEESVKRLNETLDKLNKGQGSLGRLLQDPGLYDKAEKAVEDVRKTVKPLAALSVSLEARSEYYGRSAQFKNDLAFSLWVADKNLVLGRITQDPRQEGFTYSLQWGHRWGKFAGRVGVFESDFGLGLDAYALDRRVQVSLDGFAFGRDSGPRFRLAGRLYPLKPVYFVLGLDDFTLASRREFYLGLGVEVR